MIKKARLLLGLVLVIFSVSALGAQETDAKLQEGKSLYLQGRYEQALTILRDILLNPNAQSSFGEASFWIGKNLMAEARLEEAAKAFELFIANYPDNANQAEAVYQIGRIYFLQGEYQKALQTLARFIEKYPQSPLIANAYYWSGESLYAAARLDEAKDLFNLLIQKYPESSKLEAAKYKISLITLKKREQQLLELLKWSHQENIRNLEDFRSRELEYEDALRNYQQKLYSLSSDDFKSELQTLQNKIDTQNKERDKLQAKIDELNNQMYTLSQELTELQNQLEAANLAKEQLQKNNNKSLNEALSELERQKALLDAREEALRVKEELLEKADSE